MSRPPFVILSLSGGGYCGLYTASLLKKLEHMRGRPLQEAFNLVCGTSIGGMIALSLAMGKSPAEIVATMEQFGNSLFKGDDRGLFQKCRRAVNSLVTPKYSAEHLKRTASALLDGKFMRDAALPVVTVAASLTAGEPREFASFPVHASDRDLPAIDAALATSAAPTYFPAHPIGNELFVDGGIIANTPDLVAIQFALSHFGARLEDLVLLSIGAINSNVSTASRRPRFEGRIYRLIRFRTELAYVMELQQQLSVKTADALLKGEYDRISATPSPQQSPYCQLDRADKYATSTLHSLALASFSKALEHPTRAFNLVTNCNFAADTSWHENLT